VSSGDGSLRAGATVLLTGATGGIGQAIARALADRGARLIITGRRAELLDTLAREVDGRALRCDLARRDDLQRLAAVAESEHLDVLVANAALPASGLLTELTAEQVDRMLEVNLRAPIALAHALAPGMVARRSGHMVFISSLAGKAASPASSLYSATKFGLRGFALGLRADLREHHVGVSIVLPGFIRNAGMFADAGVTLPRGVGTRTPQEVAAAVIRAIDHNRAEVEVAPLGLRLGAAFAAVAPGAAAAASRWMGSDRIAAALAEGQRDKR
jgi:short-subunit dehydrogenase